MIASRATLDVHAQARGYCSDGEQKAIFAAYPPATHPMAEGDRRARGRENHCAATMTTAMA